MQKRNVPQDWNWGLGIQFTFDHILFAILGREGAIQLTIPKKKNHSVYITAALLLIGRVQIFILQSANLNLGVLNFMSSGLSF